MIINEYRLNLADERAQKILMDQMEAFFYGGGVEPPPDWVPPAES
jgi:Fe-S cluster biosynthesis and repair protein YggX